MLYVSQIEYYKHMFRPVTIMAAFNVGTILLMNSCLSSSFHTNNLHVYIILTDPWGYSVDANWLFFYYWENKSHKSFFLLVRPDFRITSKCKLPSQ